MNQVFIATAKKFNRLGHQFDKHGLQNIVLVPLAGISPRNLNVIAGTVAEKEGFNANTTYVVRGLEQEPYTNPETGVTTRSFNYTMIAEIGAMDAFKMLQEDKMGKLTTLIKENVPVKATVESIVKNNVIKSEVVI